MNWSMQCFQYSFNQLIFGRFTDATSPKKCCSRTIRRLEKLPIIKLRQSKQQGIVALANVHYININHHRHHHLSESGKTGHKMKETEKE